MTFEWPNLAAENLTLLRGKSPPGCTFGNLYSGDGEWVCVTLEEPWRDNADNISRVPAGTYPWFKRVSPKRGYEVVELRDVPNRENVQIHIGNTVEDTLGCILVGSAKGEGENITGSRLAFQKLMAELKDTPEGTIQIVDAKT